MDSATRCFGLVLACVAVAWARPAAAQAISEQLEGAHGSRPISAQLGLMGQTLNGTLQLSASEQLGLEGQLHSKPLTQGLTSCTLAPSSRDLKQKHKNAQLVGICELDELNGAATLSFEGYWREPGRTEERVVLTSRRVLAAQLWQRYGAMLPAPVATSTQQPPANCASTPSIDAVVRDSSKRAFVLHSVHFHCVEAPYNLEWSSYAAALSVLDESGAAPAWLGSVPVPHGVADASDVVSWEADLGAFWLTPRTLGLVVSAGGTISGSGVITTATSSIFAVDSAAPRFLLSVAGDSFGKSNIENYGGESVQLYATQATSREPARLLVSNQPWSTVDGVDQNWPATDEAYRFDPRSVSLQRQRAPSRKGSKWLAIGPNPPRVLTEVSAPPSAL